MKKCLNNQVDSIKEKNIGFLIKIIPEKGLGGLKLMIGILLNIMNNSAPFSVSF